MMSKWTEIKTTVRTHIKTDMELLTVRQWAKKGYIPINNDAGKMLWSNSFCNNHQYWYLFADEVRPATKEEIAEFLKILTNPNKMM